MPTTLIAGLGSTYARLSRRSWRQKNQPRL
jgi:hypothetical protein